MTSPRAILLLWIGCLIVAGAWIWREIEVEHDLQAFLPPGERPVEALLMSEAMGGVVSRLVFVAFEGGRLDQRLTASRTGSERLPTIDGVERVANGAVGLDADAFEPLFPHRYLLEAPPSLDAQGLRVELEARLQELRSPLGVAAEARLESDPTATFRHLLHRLGETTTAPPLEQGVWVTEDRTRSLLLATIEDTGGDLGREALLIEAMRSELLSIAEGHDVQLLMAGRPALAAVARNSVRASFVTGSIIASILVISLLLWLFRSGGVLLLGILPLASGAICGLAAVLAIFGAVHGIALAFGVTLLGIAIDYPLHLFSHHKSGQRLETTARHIQRPLFLGAFTTAAAFTVFGTGSTPGLGQLACFTSVGIAIAALVLRYVVPALADSLDIKPKPLSFRLLPDKAPGFLLPCGVLVVVAALTWLGTRDAPLFETDIAGLNPLPDEAKMLDRKLRDDLGAPDLRFMLLVEGDDAETVLNNCETLLPRLRDMIANNVVTGFDAPCRYLPSQRLQAERQSALPTADALAATLDEALVDLPFRSGVFEGFLAAIDEGRNAVPLDAESGSALFADTPFAGRLDHLLNRFEGRWYAFLPLIGVADVEKLEGIGSAQSAVELVDLKVMSEGYLADVRNEALLLLALAIIGAMLLMAVLGHALTNVLASLGALLLSLVVTTAILALVGESLTMLHVLAALLVVGLAIDYAVFLAWPARDDQQDTQRALIACVLSTTIVFGLLASSSIGVLRAIGLTVAVGAFTTFAAAYVIFSRRQG